MARAEPASTHPIDPWPRTRHRSITDIEDYCMAQPASDVVFLFPKVFKEIYYEGCDYYLGAGYIRAFLGRHGIATHQFIDSGDKTIGEVARDVLAHRPLIMGFSCYDANYFYINF
jgi:hypothetical protein